MATDRPPLPDALRALHDARAATLIEAGVDLDALRADPAADAAVTALLVGSDWAVTWLARHPEVLGELIAADAHRTRPDADALRAELAAVLDGIPPGPEDTRPDGDLGRALRRFRNRQQIAVQLRDLAGAVPLDETVGALSDLAEGIVDLVLERLQRGAEAEWGVPVDDAGRRQTLTVLAMGKLGARELNLSSDIDLILVHERPGRTERADGGEPITVQEFFVRVAQRLVGLLDTRTAAGFVFRIDLRLRPFGESGPLVHHGDAILDYYEEQGRDWERYALIKARAITGDPDFARRLDIALRPFVYRRYLDFGAIDALREMKRLIRREVRRRRLGEDVKLGEGGIREVEFVAQVFQLIHGGRDRRFRERALLPVLDALAEADCLPADDVGELKAAYRFLRDVEHRIQALDDEQTQRLPAEPERRARIAWSLGFDAVDAFEAALDGHRRRVAGHFADLIADPEPEESGAGERLAPWRELWSDPGGDDDDRTLLEHTGFGDPEAAVARLRDLRRQRDEEIPQAVGVARLDALMPRLLAAVAAGRSPDLALARCVPLVETVLRRTAYLVLLTENPDALEQLVRLAGASQWVAATLTRHPILLDELLDARSLYTVPTFESLRAELDEHLRAVDADDLEQQMEQLRYFKEATELRVAACELAGTLPLMKVSDALTWLAEVILDRVVALAWRQTVGDYGHPVNADGVPGDDAFAVVGYGKFGGLELGWGSDLDLVFLHDLPPQGTTDGERAVANAQFLARLGQRINHLLATRTHTGALYEVDLRLRPSGGAGVLVSSLEAFAGYQRDDAWTWEHQALVRARAVVGAPRMREAFDAIRREVLGRERDREALREEIVAMRSRMLSELAGLKERPDAETLAGRTELDLKQAPGAVVDIEFMVQFRVLGWGRAHPELLLHTDAIRTLETARDLGLVSPDEADLLIESYKEFRAEAHRCALDAQGARTRRADLIERANRIAALWMRRMEAPGSG